MNTDTPASASPPRLRATLKLLAAAGVAAALLSTVLSPAVSSAQSQSRSVRISWGSDASSRDDCPPNTECRNLSYEYIGDWPSPPYSVECWGNGRRTVEPFQWSGRPHTGCYYWGGTAQVVINGVRSNTITFQQGGGCGTPSALGRNPSRSVSGSWDSSCTSGRRTGKYARLYGFTLSGTRTVTIDLESSVDTYLYLLDANNREIEHDDDSGDGTNSRITRRLNAGTYRIETTTYNNRTSGNFTLRVNTANEVTGCNVPYSLGSNPSRSVSGSWDSSCTSGRRTGKYARLYGFTLSGTRTVTIDLESSVDTYLYLLDANNREIEHDDDSGDGTNSRITRRLNAGTYRIETTTYNNRTSGNFTLRVNTSDQDSGGGCGTPSALGRNPSRSVSGSWDSSCTSGRRTGKYARLYGFTLSGTRTVTIDLESSVDTYLYLLDANNREIEHDDDSGDGTNSRITRRLNAGTYRIETTTYNNRTSGNFTLRVNTSDQDSGGGCGTPSALGRNPSRSVSGSWDSSCTSGRRTGKYARLYGFTLSGTRTVTIDLESSVDTYLYLLDANNREIERDDDSGDGTNSRITRRLNAGTYRIETTTYNNRTSGNFTLRVNTANEVTGCNVPYSLGSNPSRSVSGSWDSSCTSGRRTGKYARLYGFTLDSTRNVTIDLESSVDTYLYLLDANNRQIERDDDDGDGTNSRITRRLNAGTYRIETTTYNNRTSGNFTLRVNRTNTGPSTTDPSTPGRVGPVSIDWDKSNLPWDHHDDVTISWPQVPGASEYEMYYWFAESNGIEETIADQGWAQVETIKQIGLVCCEDDEPPEMISTSQTSHTLRQIRDDRIPGKLMVTVRALNNNRSGPWSDGDPPRLGAESLGRGLGFATCSGGRLDLSDWKLVIRAGALLKLVPNWARLAVSVGEIALNVARGCSSFLDEVINSLGLGGIFDTLDRWFCYQGTIDITGMRLAGTDGDLRPYIQCGTLYE